MGGGGSQPPINLALAGSAESGAGLSGNFSRIFAGNIAGGKRPNVAVFAIGAGVLLLIGLAWVITRR